VRFRRESAELALARDARDILVRRGRVLRARQRLSASLAALRDGALAGHAVREIVLGGARASAPDGGEERLELLATLLANPHVGTTAREYLQRLTVAVARRARAADERALRGAAESGGVAELLLLRLEARRARTVHEEAVRSLSRAGLPFAPAVPEDPDRTRALDLVVRRRLVAARRAILRGSRRGRPGPGDLGELRRLDELLRVPHARRRAAEALESARRMLHEELAERLGSRLVLGPADGGVELAPWIGPKAANLAEIERVLGEGVVPRWFAVADSAFRRALAARADSRGSAAVPGTLESAIRDVLALGDPDPAAKSSAIGRLWAEAGLPADVEAAVARGYEDLGADPEDDDREAGPPWVAVRSSAREEDREEDARAGEFETFLFVRGVRDLLVHLRRTWAGLWTERAIRSRGATERSFHEVGGGVLVQRIVRARVSGVLQTLDVGGAEPGEMRINAGLGLGEGVVSGAVDADEIRVSRAGPADGPLRVRYVVRDKTEQVVFDRRAGFGTIRVPTKYHQRLRPALEYVELEELVRAARALETAWRCPLDLEFAFDSERLFILQARPVPSFFAALRETVERYPLARRRTSSASRPAEELPS
jgi:hypothetical protein